MDWDVYRRCEDIKKIRCRAKGTKTPVLVTTVTADSGATMNTMGAKDAARLGVATEDLEPSAINIIDASGGVIKTHGMFLAKIECQDKDTGRWVYAKGPMYVRENYNGRVFVSEDTLVDLGVKGTVNSASAKRGRGMHAMKSDTKGDMNTDEAAMEALEHDGCFDSPCDGCDSCGIQQLREKRGGRASPQRTEGEMVIKTNTQRKPGLKIPLSVMTFASMVQRKLKVVSKEAGKCEETCDKDGERT